LLTGRYASRFGIDQPIALKSKQALPEGARTLSELLRQNGYTTAITGKWHLGLSMERGFRTYGFDHAYGFCMARSTNIPIAIRMAIEAGTVATSLR
jgi:arylsulfatase A-like enzyme